MQIILEGISIILAELASNVVITFEGKMFTVYLMENN